MLCFLTKIINGSIDIIHNEETEISVEKKYELFSEAICKVLDSKKMLIGSDVTEITTIKDAKITGTSNDTEQTFELKGEWKVYMDECPAPTFLFVPDNQY